MKTFLLFTAGGPMVIITSRQAVTDTAVLDKLADKGLEKFIAYELAEGELALGVDQRELVRPLPGLFGDHFRQGGEVPAQDFFDGHAASSKRVFEPLGD